MQIPMFFTSRSSKSSLKMSEVKVCDNGEILSVSSPCPPQFSAPYDYQFPASPDLGNVKDNNNTVQLLLSAKVVAALIILAAIVSVIGWFIKIKLYQRILWDGRAPQIREDEGRLQDFIARPVPIETQAVPLRVDGSGMEDKLIQLLPVLEYADCRSYGVARGRIRATDLQRFPDETMPASSGAGVQHGYDECAVCLSPFQEKESVKVLPTCRHLFHVNCIDTWLQSHANCPLCRENITLPAIEQLIASIMIDSAEISSTINGTPQNGGAQVQSG
ncbi:hypothetical protein KP509_01G091800 [Ceratopteris richardii]|uniref:RING-type E3 ubiquitin transferase n=1 Tax=Ceratopteris richardii TaxID=49495 RepID=A0A8T2VNI3_CERRI|nr:hypothetical protein KP509_01G091800 [Ceratopteris richardii]